MKGTGGCRVFLDDVDELFWDPLTSWVLYIFLGSSNIRGFIYPFFLGGVCLQEVYG
jgi:hypothetical protein